MEREARASENIEDPRRSDRILGKTMQEAATRFLRPDRPQLEQVSALLTDDIEPQEAWEILASRGLIPIDWTDASSRQIHVDGARCERCHDRAPYVGHAEDCVQKNSPPTLLAALTLAANPAAVYAVEALAKEAFQRLFRDDTPLPPIVWRVMAPSLVSPLSEYRPGHAQRKSSKIPLYDALRKWMQVLEGRRDFALPEGCVRDAAGRIVGPNGLVRRGGYRLMSFVTEHQGWIRAAEIDLHNHWNWALAARESRPNPFTPLVDAWLLGYAIEVINDESIVLFAPEPFYFSE
jgi:hypothetical protein